MAAERLSVQELLEQSDWLRRLASSLVLGEAAADDLVQETWLAALRHPPAPGRPLRPWLARVARNLASRFRRSEARRRAHEAGARAGEPELDPGTLTSEVEAQRLLADALLRLEEPLRVVLVLRYFREFDSRAIGRQLELPDGTVRWRLKRALERLREDLDQRHGGERQAWSVAFAAWLPRAPRVIDVPPDPTTGIWLMSASTKIFLTTGAVLLASWFLWRKQEVGSATAGSVQPSIALRDSSAPIPSEAFPAKGREQPSTSASERSEPEPLECCVGGRVLDPEGRGLAGAKVLARTPRLGGGLREQVEGAAEFSTLSGAGGLYSLALPARRPFVLSAEHPAFAATAIAAAFASERHDLALLPGSQLVVTVRSTAGAASAGAEVRAWVDLPDLRGELWMAEGRTDARGTVVFEGAPAGEGHVEARSATDHGERRVELDGHSSARCELELFATGILRGTVLDRRSGLPIAGARVGSPEHGVPEVTTDARGRYVLTSIGLGTGLWSLAAHARGYAARFELLRLPPEAPERTQDFALERAASVGGRVTGHSARPLAGARVVFLAMLPVEPYTAALDRAEVTTDANGRFALSALHSGVRYRVLVIAAGHATGVFARGPFAGGVELEIEEFRLASGGSLAGSVPEHESNGSFHVRLQWIDDPEGGGLETHLETTRADPRGRFAFDGLASGRYRLSLVEARERRAASAVLAEVLVELAPGEARRGIVFHPGAGAIAGRVSGPGGRKAGGCRVGLFALDAPGVELARTDTDGNGDFRLHTDQPGPFRLVIEDRALLLEARVLEPVELGSVDLALELGEFRSPFAIHGRLVAEPGTDMDGLFVGFRAARGERLARVAIPELDGSFTMRDLGDEAYDLELVDFALAFEPVRVPGVRPGDGIVELRLVPRE